MSYIAELRNVTKIFGKAQALDNVNLQIREGEILGLLGPNGSGKTTLLKILAFIEEPTKGEVYFGGVEVLEKNREQTRMQSTMVFQKTVLFGTNVYENVAYGLKVRGTPKTKVDEEVHKALSLVKLEGFEKRQARKLSGGEQQRVTLARALVLDPRLLLLDEPTANLDPKNASIIEEAIAMVNRELRTTVVMATHNMFQAKNLPQRVALITEGQISEIGEPVEIFGKLSKTLASFAALDNTFIGEARVTDDGASLVNIGSNVEVVTTAQGKGKVSIFISPKDIILSRERLASSARNILPGRIIEVSDMGSIVKLKVDAGKSFTVQITKRSFNEIGLNLNADVFLTFKASSVQII